MKLFVLLLSLCFLYQPLPQKNDPYAHEVLLNYYQTATKNEEVAHKFVSLMNRYEGKDPLKLGYKAVSQAIMAKHVWSPMAKLRYLRQSAAIFEQAVALDRQDAEVRFLRFSIENYIPGYLNMSSHLEEDKKVFLGAMLRHPRSGISGETMKIMRDFLVRKELLTKQEQQQLEKITL